MKINLVNESLSSMSGHEDFLTTDLNDLHKLSKGNLQAALKDLASREKETVVLNLFRAGNIGEYILYFYDDLVKASQFQMQAYPEMEMPTSQVRLAIELML